MPHTPPIIYGQHEAPHYAGVLILTVTMWKSGVYHLLLMCQVYIEVKVKLSASECCYPILWNRFARRTKGNCLYAPLKDEVTAGTVLVHSTESGISEGKGTVHLLKMTSGGNGENKTLNDDHHTRKTERSIFHTQVRKRYTSAILFNDRKKAHTIFIILTQWWRGF